jgi:[NiFe] hydrogenase assembly HybE family chaperone
MNGFEGSFGGNSSRLDPGSVLECGVCWWIYDPALGDDTWQIPAGTAFADLPSHWRCPNCDNPPQQFMVVKGRAATNSDSHQRPQRPAGLELIREREQQLLQAYSAVNELMRELPVYNPKLNVQVIGLHRWQEGLLGVVATPWCMNITLLPLDEHATAAREGTSRELLFPSGRYSFIAAQLAGIGPLETCSLFSPMDEFDDPAVVEQVARHALEELLRAPAVNTEEPSAASGESPDMSRRRFLRVGSGRSRDKPTA